MQPKGPYKRFQKGKRRLVYGYALVSIGLFFISYGLQLKSPWFSNLTMGLAASCVASVLYSVLNNIPKKYAILKKEVKEKEEIIQKYWECFENANFEYTHSIKDGDYDRALRWIEYLLEKSSNIRTSFLTVQELEHILREDLGVKKFQDELAQIEMDYGHIKKKGIADAPENINATIMDNIEKRLRENYITLFVSCLHDKVEIEMIMQKNRYY